MDEQALKGLGPQADPTSQARALDYFERLKKDERGWQLCIETLSSGTVRDDHVKFFCFQVIESYVKSGYPVSDMQERQYLRKFLSQWIQMQCSSTSEDRTFVKNKVAQVISLAFVVDYPDRWPTFFSDLLSTLSLGPQAVDLYIRVLMAIDGEVVDREIAHSNQETERNTIIKDTMREQCVIDLVDSWYHIITTYDRSHPQLTCRCLEAIGAYVSWIDINLIANHRFVSLLVRFLSETFLRESACECIHEIISKGMDPVAKTTLVESFISVLDSAKVLYVPDDDESEFVVKLAKLINGIGTSLIQSWTRLAKAGNQQSASVTLEAIERKVPLMLRFLSHDYDEVALAVTEFAREYIQLLKQLTARVEVQQEHLKDMLCVIIKKSKFDSSYNFAHEGEDEAEFLEFRKQLKVVFDNLAQLDKDLVLRCVHSLFMNALQQWQTLPFEDVEVAIAFLYLLGEAIPASQGNHFVGDGNKVSAVHEMMGLMVTSRVCCHTHQSVSLQFFETIVRYEKYFNHEPQHIPDILMAFLDNRGLQHESPKVRSRTAYLFSRFIKCLKAHMQMYTEEVLKQLQALLVLSPPDNGIPTVLLSPDDQLFLFEAAGVLIVTGQFEPHTKQLLIGNLLTPVVAKFEVILQKLGEEQDPERQQVFAECLNHAISVTSRTSKAFSNQQTMRSCGCVNVYLNALQVFLRALQIHPQQSILQSGVRQFLHRMVVCLEEELLPFIPQAAESLLNESDIRSIQEFIPLINQIIAKFKKEIVPFLQRIFMPLVNAIFSTLGAVVDENDLQARRDRQTLQRSYFLFIAAIITNNVTEVIASQDVENMRQVLLTIIQGTVDFPDPVAQKTCFTILRKLVEMWGGREGPTGFHEFMYQNIISACFMAPLNNTFDLTDAQTTLALYESALCLKAMLEKRGDELIHYLQSQYLPSLNLSPQLINDYCNALKSDTKFFKTFLKNFFMQTRT